MASEPTSTTVTNVVVITARGTAFHAENDLCLRFDNTRSVCPFCENGGRGRSLSRTTLIRSLIRVAPSGVSGNNACGKVPSSSNLVVRFQRLKVPSYFPIPHPPSHAASTPQPLVRPRDTPRRSPKLVSAQIRSPDPMSLRFFAPARANRYRSDFGLDQQATMGTVSSTSCLPVFGSTTYGLTAGC